MKSSSVPSSVVSSVPKMAIKPGDSVVCINDDRAFGRLYRGSIYKASLAYDDKTVGVLSGGAFHCIERFEKAKGE